MDTTLRKGSGEKSCGGTIDERIEQVKVVFSEAGIRNWEEAVTFQDSSIPPVARGEKVVAELDEDEELFYSLLHYVLNTRGEGGRMGFMVLAALRETFWMTMRARYGYLDHGDLGVRMSEGSLVLVERPETREDMVERMDIEQLLGMVGLRSGVVRN